MKKYIYLFLFISIVHYTKAQGLTKSGEITTNVALSVSSNGAIGASTLVNKNGQVATATVPLVFGQAYQGGKIFYFFVSGDPGYVEGETHGLIVAKNMMNCCGSYWGISNTVTGATGNAAGAGFNNNALIVADQGAGSYAAALCDQYSAVDANAIVFSDWYLPSKKELQLLRPVYTSVTTGYNNGAFWSSTEESSTNAAGIRFFDGGYYSGSKTSSSWFVCAIRKF